MPWEGNMAGRDVAKVTVVIVNDDQATLRVTSNLLTANGYDVVAASGIDRALKMVEEVRPEAVVFSILNPPALAIDFARRLALNSAIRFTPVVMVTALSEYQISSFLDGVPGVRRIVSPACDPDALKVEIVNAMRHVRR